MPFHLWFACFMPPRQCQAVALGVVHSYLWEFLSWLRGQLQVALRGYDPCATINGAQIDSELIPSSPLLFGLLVSCLRDNLVRFEDSCLWLIDGIVMFLAHRSNAPDDIRREFLRRTPLRCSSCLTLWLLVVLGCQWIFSLSSEIQYVWEGVMNIPSISLSFRIIFVL